jgi:hypothetical protein
VCLPAFFLLLLQNCFFPGHIYFQMWRIPTRHLRHLILSQKRYFLIFCDWKLTFITFPTDHNLTYRP